jgi:predicted phage terminase large subunit-like protein
VTLEHPILWARWLLPHHFSEPSPLFHWKMAELIFGPDPRVAVAAPRGFSKTTLASLACPLYGAGNQLFSYCILIGDTKEQAEMFLSEIRHEAETNNGLLMVHPGLRPAKPWSSDELCFTNGVLIQAIGAGQKIRGRKHRGRRPDFVLGDDLENDEQVSSLPRRLKYRRWLRAAVLPALAPEGRIRIVGTVLHSDSLLSRLIRNHRWTRRLWSALSEDGRSLWPARFPPEVLLAEKEEAREDGMLSVWYQERQNKAIADEESAFRLSDFMVFDELPPDTAEFTQRWTTSLYVDPAIGEKEQNDFTAYTVVTASWDGYWFVREAFRSKDDPAKVVETIRRLHEKWKCDVIGIESNAYQKSIGFWCKHQAEEEDGISDLPIEPVTADTDKRRRIMALQPYYRAHRILHHRSIGPRLDQELLNLNSIDHDDLADSLAGHLLITRRPEPPKKRAKRFESSRDERAYRHKQEMKRRSRLSRWGIEE